MIGTSKHDDFCEVKHTNHKQMSLHGRKIHRYTLCSQKSKYANILPNKCVTINPVLASDLSRAIMYQTAKCVTSVRASEPRPVPGKPTSSPLSSLLFPYHCHRMALAHQVTHGALGHGGSTDKVTHSAVLRRSAKAQGYSQCNRLTMCL